MILTLDLGTSATKAVLWSERGPVAVGRGEIATFYPEPGWAEQDADDWWSSVVVACQQARAGAGERWGDVEAIAFSAARETFVPVDGGGEPLGRGLLWSDRRAGEEAAELASVAGGVDQLREQTGMVVDAGAAAAKVAWLQAHEPGRLVAARWLLAPRDLVVLRLTGEAITDTTLAGRTAFYDRDGEVLAATAAPAAGLLPPVRPPTTVLRATPDGAAALDVPAGLPVVLGAGDRACEVLGSGSGPSEPMVSWGTTTNVSVPSVAWPDPLPAGITMSAGALGGHLVEAGLSASGAALEWLGRLTGRSGLELADAAAASEPGARGVVSLPWLNGARAPWWRPGARAAVLNLAPAHDAGDVARATIEAVAFDVARSLAALPSPTSGFAGLCATGGGVASSLWVSLLGAICDLPVGLRRSGEAASAGACLLAGAALGVDLELERVNPIVARTPPDRALVNRYRELRPLADRVAGGVLALDLSEWSTGWT